MNTGKDDALPAMTARAEKRKFNFTYLYDPSQEIARKYGALFTPEFFVLDKDRKVVYTGAMDNRRPPASRRRSTWPRLSTQLWRARSPRRPRRAPRPGARSSSIAKADDE